MRHPFLIALLFLFPIVARTELAPSAYEAMQASAPDYVRIEVLRVDVEPGAAPTDQNVNLVVTVSEVIRTGSDLKPGDIITITYVLKEHPKGWAGPGPVPLLSEKQQTVAYLKKEESGDFSPAAGRMSFSNF